MKIRIGVLGTADIALRKMIPAILESDQFEYAGVAIAAVEERDESFGKRPTEDIWEEKRQRALMFQEKFGGICYESFKELLQCENIDAVYIPLPPALHFRWADEALECGKHVLMEKPFTCREDNTKALIQKAINKGLTIWENYAFVYHKQTELVRCALQEIGDIRLIRATFGFPHRQASDFRYKKNAGGGALLDCGGYTIKAAGMFMKGKAAVATAQLICTPGHEVDIYGSAVLTDEDHTVAQLAFGMDNAYICELQIWGSAGQIIAPRFFTAPPEMEVPVIVKRENQEEVRKARSNQFLRSLEEFAHEIGNPPEYKASYGQIENLAGLMKDVYVIGKEV